jgi:xylose isomerase
MDAFARALIIADNILNRSDYKKVRKNRYASFDKAQGKEFEEGKTIIGRSENLCNCKWRATDEERQAGIP